MTGPRRNRAEGPERIKETVVEQYGERRTQATTRRRFLRWVVSAGVAGFVLPPGRWDAFSDPVPVSDPAETARAWRAMGTLIEVRVPDLPEPEAVEAIRRVRRRVEELEAAMTLFRSESPLVRFNRSNPGEWVDVPEALMNGVASAIDGFNRSRGGFDPTVKPAMQAWGLYDLEGRTPPPRFFRRWASRPRAEAVEMDAANRRLRRLDPRVQLDLGGVGKGIAVDAALAVLGSAGSRSALVNLGGSIGVLGPPPWDSDGWPVGLVDPGQPETVAATFPLAGGHVATSGVYERWVDTANGRKHHLLDPDTGQPTRGIQAVTVHCVRGVDADLQSTVELVGRSKETTSTPPALFPRAVVMVSGRIGMEVTPNTALSGP